MSSVRTPLLAVLLTAAALAISGCSTLGTLAYLVNPNDIAAEFDELSGKHVAVVCQPVVELQYSDAGSSRELAQLVGMNLERNIRRAEVIGQQEVARWIDENELLEYPELGKALDADIVIGIDLEDFRLYEGSTLYRGKATVHATDCSEQQFRGMFMQVLSGKIARIFYPHDSRTHFAEENLSF